MNKQMNQKKNKTNKKQNKQKNNYKKENNLFDADAIKISTFFADKILLEHFE